MTVKNPDLATEMAVQELLKGFHYFNMDILPLKKHLESNNNLEQEPTKGKNGLPPGFPRIIEPAYVEEDVETEEKPKSKRQTKEKKNTEDEQMIEFVYPIIDEYATLKTTKSSDCMVHTNAKLFNTIEKMINILISRVSDLPDSTPETEIQVMFDGSLCAQRKAFESIINCDLNLVVTNFYPGAWGDDYLKMVQSMMKKYKQPKKTPRRIARVKPNANRRIGLRQR